ncbi:23S rRNA (guanosine(2251)-2'-O)-methyltransferase RlmB [Actinocatenispora rupis]|uniref:23S rRNA (Guanosine(2251)-2'-O)-methyltransferase RlmB n=1 Tax=Actinocatenispora rupis TaxID=519421 RepID=A0A8J3JE97_9ACTN|nr:23S rRNA (guanosine(2251)-2'-O)-methyltransferase RlmB [Actinocatenispora rupis]GID15114.1 23S rRNA (guanosine(2251)-2'-O)-methyltransferase RlmB [Actinocatenispora rupis]
MPGNSQRRNRRTSSKKDRSVGSGGKGKQSLAGRGRTLPADERPWHKKFSPGEGEELPKRTAWKQEKERRKAAAEGHAPKAGQRKPAASGRSGPRVAPGRRSAAAKDAPELLVGRNPVVEALRAHIPVTALYVAQGIELDERTIEAVRTAGDRGIAIMEVSRAELDRLTGGVLHQGIGVQVPPYEYEPFEDLIAASTESPAPLLVALDGVTDPRNLGAIVRSAAAFGAQGVFLPSRRSAGMTATAWRTSAGAAARLPVAQITNMTRAIKQCQDAGFLAIGLDADGEIPLYELEAAVDPVVLVVGSEGRGLSRLVGETCDMRVAIPIATAIESLNASVATAVALAEISRRRGS